MSAGQNLATGQAVGLVSSTGLSTGPHLHFEVLLDGQYSDPMAWLGPAAEGCRSDVRVDFGVGEPYRLVQ
ncbi:M23 family metallopeptidase [Streptomyces thermocarboxydus]